MRENRRSRRSSINIRFSRDECAAGLPCPKFATHGSAGLDIAAAIPDDMPIVLNPGERVLVTTGLRIAVPRGFEAQVRSRSGWAVNDGITVLNSPGTIDSDYRGVVKVLLINFGDKAVTIRRGDRIAQIVICEAPRARLVEVADLDPTERNEGGFGSTGLGF